MGMFGLTVMIFLFNTYGTYFYVVHLGLPMQAIAAANIIITVWGAMVNPIAGHLSDRTRTKMGRRKPWLLVFVPLLTIAIIMMFSPPAGIGLAIYFAVLSIVGETSHTTAFLNYNALLPELFREERERNRANAIRQALQFVGMVIGVSLVPLIAVILGFSTTAVLLSFIGAFSTFYAVTGCKERQDFIESKPPPLVDTIRTLAKSRNFWCISMAFFFYQVSLGLILGGIPFFIRFTLNEHEGMTALLSGAIFAAAIPAMAVWYRLINRFGPIKTWRIALGWLGVSLIPMIFVGNIVWACIAALFIGMGISGMAANLDMVHSRLVDDDAEKSGLRREASFFAGISFVARISGLVRSGVFFLLFFLFAFESAENPGPVPEVAARYMMVVFPAVFMSCGLGAALMARFGE